jgi:hypothetical protein
VLWVILGLIVAVGIYLLISTGGIGEMKAKLQQFKNREFGDILRGNRLNSGPREETDTDDQDRPPEGS